MIFRLCVSLVKTIRVIPILTPKGQFENLTRGQGQVKLGHIAYHTIRSDETNTLMQLSLACVIRFKSYKPKHVFPIGL